MRSVLGFSIGLRGWSIVFGAVVSLALRGGGASAKECGGARPCECGDRVVEGTRLETDLGPCPGEGLRLVAPVSLDGGGHVIRGSRRPDTGGIVVTEKASGGFLQNVEVTGFERGIRLVGAKGVQLTNIQSHHNGDVVAHVGYGIDVAGGSSSNRIERSRIHDNADEGIHFGSQSRGNRLAHSEIRDNFRENVYFLESAENVVEDCEVRGGGNDSFYVKNSRGTILARNRIADRPLTVRGSSTGTQLIDNQLSGAALVLRDYRDRGGNPLVPARTVLRGGRIEGAKVCIRSDAGTDTTVEGVQLDCPDQLVLSGESSVAAVGQRIKVRCNGGGELREAEIADAPGALAVTGRADGPGVPRVTSIRRCPDLVRETVVPTGETESVAAPATPEAKAAASGLRRRVRGGR